MKRIVTLALTTALVATTAAVVAPTAVAADTAPGRYAPVGPVRVLDTRGTFAGPLSPGGIATVDLRQRVAATATAVVLNVTAVDPTADGYLTVYPGRTQRPLASNINKRAGETRSNSVTVALPDDGTRSVDVYNQAGNTQVVVDLVGYYAPVTGDTAGGSSYYSFAGPFRAYDSRYDHRLSNGYVYPGQVTTSGFDAPDVGGVTAVAVSLTAVNPQGTGYLTAWDGRGAQPFVSSVNYGYDGATPNFAVVPATQDADGHVSFAVGDNASATQLVVDVVGVYGEPGSDGATAYLPVTPQRRSDTRETGILGPDQSYDTGVELLTAVAANVNVTAIAPTQTTYLSVYPTGIVRPVVSNLNPDTGAVVASAAQVGIGFGGAYSVYNALGFVDVVSDLEGYFVTDGSDAASARHGLPVPTRVTATTRS